jgi:putative membrane protein
MIDYNPGRWSISFAFSCKGSVFPRAFCIAIPNALLTLVAHYWVNGGEEVWLGQNTQVGGGKAFADVLGGFTFILGFLIVFRCNQAYSRWWEGGTLLQQLRGEWFNAFSSLMAFCSTQKEKSADVLHFQHVLVRLMSLLYGSALAQVATTEEKRFDVIDLSGFDREALHHLQSSHDSCEVVLQWVQRLIVEANTASIIVVAPPILSRVYNQLGNGIVNLNNARKIKDFMIPFPLAQMITCMLIFHWFSTGFVCATSIAMPFGAAFLSFMVVISFWSVNYIAIELEMPFGDDANDLPLADMQMDMNMSLTAMCHKLTGTVPKFHLNPEAATSGDGTNIISKENFVEVDFDNEEFLFPVESRSRSASICRSATKTATFTFKKERRPKHGLQSRTAECVSAPSSDRSGDETWRIDSDRLPPRAVAPEPGALAVTPRMPSNSSNGGNKKRRHLDPGDGVQSSNSAAMVASTPAAPVLPTLPAAILPIPMPTELISYSPQPLTTAPTPVQEDASAPKADAAPKLIAIYPPSLSSSVVSLNAVALNDEAHTEAAAPSSIIRVANCRLGESLPIGTIPCGASTPCPTSPQSQHCSIPGCDGSLRLGSTQGFGRLDQQLARLTARIEENISMIAQSLASIAQELHAIAAVTSCAEKLSSSTRELSNLEVIR